VVIAGAAPAFADVQLWTEVGLRYDATEKVSLSFDQQVRFDDDVSRLGAVMPEFGVNYNVTDWIRVGVGYRLEYERDNSGDLVVRHRIDGGARLRANLGDVRLEYRLVYQEGIRPRSKDQYRHAIRNRGDIAYRGLKPWIPAVSVELFHAIDEGDTIHLDKIRTTVGTAYSTGPYEIEVYYRIESPRADTTEPTAHIIGTGFHYDL
jgi:hypothetical protein